MPDDAASFPGGLPPPGKNPADLFQIFSRRADLNEIDWIRSVARLSFLSVGTAQASDNEQGALAVSVRAANGPAVS
jgi:hypothetical protein